MIEYFFLGFKTREKYMYSLFRMILFFSHTTKNQTKTTFFHTKSSFHTCGKESLHYKRKFLCKKR